MAAMKAGADEAASAIGIRRGERAGRFEMSAKSASSAPYREWAR